MENTEYEIDLSEIFGMLKKRWLMIFSITAVAVIAAGVISFFVLTPVYESSSTLLVSYKQNQETVMTYNDLTMSQKLVNTYSEIIKSRSISEAVLKKLDLDLSTEELSKKITVSTVSDTEIIRVKVSDTDPEMAALIANTVSDVFKKEIKNIMEIDNVSTIDTAKASENPVKPNKLMNVAIAGVLGVMVSVGLVFVLEFLDRTYKTPADVERHLGLPIIGAIPDMELTQGK
ncbi:YveK family protein [Turicibacter sanguinis]|uniref:YveK family protein n=1 Tax=Turicibacter sanguinis TaxID=154288 RepID=UPI0018AC7842|nr:Wzz/FepE/Etk N-terminal domain-containing protein [Turicibacter sanguinis]MDB8558251.1 Wzz/FepE/Etk N-terminal domain-containing protein [Turicibacter sanguinis]MDB8561027.1 Wzz/FepE/Etk N-terminal domain-containing protein [Turicibacter sanguinis]